MLPGFLQSLFSCLYTAGKHINCMFFTNNVEPSPNPVKLMESLISFKGPLMLLTPPKTALLFTNADFSGIKYMYNFFIKGALCLCVHHDTGSAMCLQSPEAEGELSCSHDGQTAKENEVKMVNMPRTGQGI